MLRRRAPARAIAPRPPVPYPHPLPSKLRHSIASLPRAVVRERAVLHRGHLEVDVDAVEQGSRDAGEVALDAEGPADAIVPRIAEIAAGTSPRCLFAM